MGMYTNYSLHVELLKDTPEEVMERLRYLNDTAKGDIVPPDPDDPFWLPSRMRWVTTMAGAAYHIARPPILAQEWDESWSLTVLASLKNYGGEIELLLQWLAPHIDSPYGRTFIGWVLYEEDEEPTLLYANKGEVEWVYPQAARSGDAHE